MIKIHPAEDIGKWIGDHLPKWHGRADDRSKKDLLKGHYVERDKIWKELKPFFIGTQIEKCAYCESRLGSNGVHWEIEHYRPKARVISWQSKESPDFPPDQPSSAQGYYKLAYQASNYLASCGSCNRPKSDYFPVLAKRQLDTTDALILASESPLLINPIDADDEDPEDLIEFDGPFPTPRCKEGICQLRALATIELLNLKGEQRIHDRCAFIRLAWGYYQNRDDKGKKGHEARDFIDAAAERKIAHSNCVRSFLRLCAVNQSEAETLADLAQAVVLNVIQPPPPDRPAKPK